MVYISIHSLRMEGDFTPALILSIASYFLTCISIHSLRMEGDVLFSIFIIPRRAFQSTPSAWRETVAEVYFCLWLWYFNPLPPHGGRLGTQTEKNRSEVFQSTPSAWRETSDMRKCYHCIFISIHSLRMEGDCSKLLTWRRRQGFQSTPSAWRETMSVQKL